MREFTRRDLIKTTGGALLGVGAAGLLTGRKAYAQTQMRYEPEKGAQINLLRWSKFVQGDEDQWNANTRKFTELTGVPVRINAESFEDIRPKAAVAANIGSGPDIILGWFDDPHQFPDKLLDVTDLATYLGQKYGGWYPVAERYGTRDGRWISLPIGGPGGCLVYRRSWVQEAGFESVPRDSDSFLKCCKALAAKGHRPGFALGNAVGDANGWLHTLLWGFGGKLVDDDNHVVVNSPETLAAL